jgi:hypothetical protein
VVRRDILRAIVWNCRSMLDGTPVNREIAIYHLVEIGQGTRDQGRRADALAFVPVHFRADAGRGGRWGIDGRRKIRRTKAIEILRAHHWPEADRCPAIGSAAYANDGTATRQGGGDARWPSVVALRNRNSAARVSRSSTSVGCM